MVSFNDVIEFVEEYLSNEDGLSIVEVQNDDDEKLSIVISENEEPVISIEILANGICDMFMVDYKTEEIAYSITDSFIDIEDLKQSIIKFLNRIRGK
jgi:hypothetical protein